MGIMRQVIGGVTGVLAAGATIALVEAVGHGAGPGVNIFGAAILGYGLGCAIGSLAATLIAGRGLSLVVPAVLAVLAVINLFAFPHPWWFPLAAVGAFAAGWLAGSGLAQSLRNRAEGSR